MIENDREHGSPNQYRPRLGGEYTHAPRSPPGSGSDKMPASGYESPLDCLRLLLHRDEPFTESEAREIYNKSPLPGIGFEELMGAVEQGLARPRELGQV